MSDLEQIESRTVTKGSSKVVNKKRVELLLLLLGLILFLTAPFYLTSEYLLKIATLVTLYATMSLGWNLIGGYAGQISLGHAVFFGIGAYTTIILQINYNLSPWVGLFIGIVVAILVAILIGFPTLQLSGHYFALGTLALLQVTHILAIYFEELTGGPVGLNLPLLGHNPVMFQFESMISYFYIGVVMLVLSLWISRTVLYSKLGYQLRAIKENPEAASLAGVNLFRSKMLALMISASIVSLAGTFYVQFIQFINPDAVFSFDMTIYMALFAIVGGVGVWWGPLLGAVILVPLSEYTSLKLTGDLAPLGQLSYGLLLILIILLRPRGIASWIISLWERWWGVEKT